MAKTLDDCLKAVQDIVGRVEGVRSAPEYATDKLGPGITSLVFPADGVYTEDPNGVLKGLHSINLLVVCPRVDLHKTLAKLIPLGDKVAAALHKERRLLDTVDTFGADGTGISYSFVPFLNIGKGDAAPAYVSGWSFTINNVKIQDSTTLS